MNDHREMPIRIRAKSDDSVVLDMPTWPTRTAIVDAALRAPLLRGCVERSDHRDSEVITIRLDNGAASYKVKHYDPTSDVYECTLDTAVLGCSVWVGGVSAIPVPSDERPAGRDVLLVGGPHHGRVERWPERVTRPRPRPDPTIPAVDYRFCGVHEPSGKLVAVYEPGKGRGEVEA